MSTAATAAAFASNSRYRVTYQGLWALQFPMQIVDHEIILLQRELRRIYLNHTRGQDAINLCLLQGEQALAATRNHLQTYLQNYLGKHGLIYPAYTVELQELFVDALKQWQHLVEDFTKTPNKLLMAALAGFWLTPQGFLHRIDLFAQDFVFSEVNHSMLIVAYHSGAYAVHWVTEGDDRVCKVCQRYGVGGDHGYYPINGFMPPPPPVHPNCRCTIEVLYQ